MVVVVQRVGKSAYREKEDIVAEGNLKYLVVE